MKKLLKSLKVSLGLACIIFHFYGICLAESVVDEGSAMIYIEPLQDLPDSGNPTGWTALDYDTSQDEGKGDPDNGPTGWQFGTYGVGYGDDDDNTTIDNDSSVYSVYTRAAFNVADVSEVVSMSLGVDYDDGFIAWINGVEVARSPSMEGVSPDDFDALSGAHEASLTNPPTFEEFDISDFTDDLVNGQNVLAIGIWNFAPYSSDLSLIPRLSLFYSSSTSPVLTRYPYIQKATSDSVTIVWNTDVESDSTVEYGPSYGSVAYDADSATQHVVALTGLSPGTTYYYRVSSGGTVLTSSGTFFQTNKDQGDSFTFVVIGDSGEASPGQSEVAQLIENVQPDLMLHTGDVIYSDIASPSTGGDAEYYDVKFFMPYKDTIKRISLYPTLGNHDINTDNGQPYLDAFVLPEAVGETGPCTGPTERYYSFGYANAHFVSLDVESSDYEQGTSCQYDWLENDLSTTDKTWKFVYFHRPLYSSNSSTGHDSYTAIREILSPLFEQYGVDMVFFAHSHHYERTFPLIEDIESADGITYVVTGGGGASLADPSALVGDYSWSAYSESTYHLVKISIDGDSLSLEAVKPDGSSDGEVFDSYTITGNDDGGLSAPDNFSSSVDCTTLFLGTTCTFTVSLSWTGVSAATGYKLYYGYSSGSYETPLDLGNVTSVTYNGIPEGTYYLAISAYDSSGNESDKSDEIVLTVGDSSVPTNFSATVSNCIEDAFGGGTNCTVSLSWTSVSTASGYYLYYGYSSGNYVGTVDVGNVTSVAYIGISEGTYYLVLTSYDSSGEESGYSDEVIVEVGSDSSSFNDDGIADDDDNCSDDYNPSPFAR